MVRKRRVFLASFLALAMIMQYSFMPQQFMSYAGEVSETDTAASVVSEPASSSGSDSASGTKSESAQSSAPSSSSSSQSASSSSDAKASASSQSAPASSDSQSAPASSDSGQKSDSSQNEEQSSAPSNSAGSAGSEQSTSAPATDSVATQDANSAAAQDANGAATQAAGSDTNADSLAEQPVADSKSGAKTFKAAALDDQAALSKAGDAEENAATATDRAADSNDNSISGSKKADPTELGDDKTTTITISLPSAEYQNEIDIVFVADNSSSTDNGGAFVDGIKTLFNTIKEKNPNLKINVGVVKFRGYASDCISIASGSTYSGLTTLSEATTDIIDQALAMSGKSVPGSGTNMHGGLVMANQWLSESGVDNNNKYVVLLTDGKSYIWNNDDDEPTTYYSQYYKWTRGKGANTIQSNGAPSLSQSVGYNKKDYALDVLDPTGKSNIFFFDTYQDLYDSTNEDLTSDTGFEQFCQYAYDKSLPQGTVIKHDVTNGTEVFGTGGLDSRYYWEFLPNDSWEGVKYYEANPYMVIDNGDGTYTFDTSRINPAYYQYHADALQKSLYKAGHLWTDMGSMYNCAAVYYGAGGTDPGLWIANNKNNPGNFGEWVQANSKYGANTQTVGSIAEMFSDISNDIIYQIGKGTVTDKITEEFDLKNQDSASAFRMKVGDDVINLSSNSGNQWFFGEANEDGVYPYVVHYDADNKIITWDINVPVENAKKASLSYGLVLKAGYGEGYYDTNEYAVLNYVSSDGKKEGGFVFEVPQVHYKENAPAPAPGGDTPDPDNPDDPDNPNNPNNDDPSTPATPTDGNGPGTTGSSSSKGSGSTGAAGTTATGGTGTLTAAAGGTGTSTITNNPAPKAPGKTVIDEPAPPLTVSAYWALINLLCAIATAFLSLIMLMRYFGKREEEDEETGEVTEIKRKGAVRLASVIPAIAGIVAFILTEDMTNPMTMVDKWTILMVVILAIQVIVAIVAKTKKSNDDEYEQASA